MSMLADFLKEHGISTEELIDRSDALEARGIADRALLQGRARARREKKAYAELELEKPRGLGRAVSRPAIDRALAGKPMPRLVRKKITRAVNSVLASKKQEAVETRKLFGDVPSRKGAKKK